MNSNTIHVMDKDGREYSVPYTPQDVYSKVKEAFDNENTNYITFKGNGNVNLVKAKAYLEAEKAHLSYPWPQE
jgi:hypothetical protein